MEYRLGIKMKKIIEDLKEIKVISKKDIFNLKIFIDKKYKDLGNKERADVLSKTIHQVLDRFTSGLNNEINFKIKRDILKNTILNGQDSIFLFNILEFYIQENKNIDEDNLEELVNWINKHIENNIDKNELINFLISEKYISPENQFVTKYNSKENEAQNIVDGIPEINKTSIDKSFRNGIRNVSNKDMQLDGLDLSEGIDNESILLHKKDIDQEFINEEDNICAEVSNNICKKKIRNIKGKILNINNKKKFYYSIVVFIIFLCPLTYFSTDCKSGNAFKQEKVSENVERKKENNIEIGQKVKDKKINPNLPQYIRYKQIDEKKLKKFLQQKKSILADEPYFSSIIYSSKEFNVNPILLFSITGQEQSFVPKNWSESKKIANNPFNVFHSWKEYNTDISDSSEIAARTVFNICSDMPKGQNPFKWINKQYAEDKEWWKGVESFFNEISKLK